MSANQKWSNDQIKKTGGEGWVEMQNNGVTKLCKICGLLWRRRGPARQRCDCAASCCSWPSQCRPWTDWDTEPPWARGDRWKSLSWSCGLWRIAIQAERKSYENFKRYFLVLRFGKFYSLHLMPTWVIFCIKHFMIWFIDLQVLVTTV